MSKVNKNRGLWEGSLTSFMILQKPGGEWRNGGEFERPLGQHTAVSIVGPLLGQPGLVTQRSSPLVGGEECSVTTLITAVKETTVSIDYQDL